MISTAADPGRHDLPRGSRRALMVALLAAMVVVAATFSSVPLASAAAATPPAPAVPRLAWADCGDGFQCATATVPLDYNRPNGATITLALNRLPATDQAQRIGSMFVNPGGPGGSGVDFVQSAARSLWSPAVRARFDIVGFDPRGVARSTPIQCFSSNDAETRFLGATPPFPVGFSEEVSYIKTFARFGGQCAARNFTIMAHMSTANVARDLDLLRQAVGDNGLTYDGVSYGTYLGDTYANLFPGHVRALIVDGVLNPVEWATGSGDGSRLPFSTRIGSARGAYDTLQQFFTLCKNAGPLCSFSSGDPRSRYYALLDRARQHPIVVPGWNPITFADIVSNNLSSLYDPLSWPFLADLLQQLDTAPAAAGPAVASLVARLAPAPNPDYFNGFDSLVGVACADTTNPRNPFAWPHAAADQDKSYPFFGSAWTWLSEPCSTWPAADGDRYAGPFDHTTSSPVLVIGNQYDPATPYQGAQAVAAMLPGARLLTLDGWGHTSLGQSQCIDRYVSAYLLTQQLPPAATHCRPDTVPFAPPVSSAAVTRPAIPSLVPAPLIRALPR